MKHIKWLVFVSVTVMAALLLAVTLPHFELVTADGSSITIGDVNGDGQITTTDARLVLQAAVQKITLSESQQTAADVDENGIVNTTDARLILQYAVEKIPTFPTKTTTTTTPTSATQRPADDPNNDIPLTEATNAVIKQNPDTFCNPVNISYQYQEGYKSRESADPCMVIYKGEYFLFASHGTGYWWSKDMVNWNFVYCTMPEINYFAPAVCVIGDTMYLTHSGGGAIYKSDDPKSGQWIRVGKPVSWGDPAFFVDDDGRVYVYYGCSPTEPIYVVELDPNNNMALLQGPNELFYENRAAHGFEVAGDQNQNQSAECWMEGPWMTKYGDTYYLQYAAPGTQYASYADGCYVSQSPMGPFTYCENSPISYKATGFLIGAGHGSTFQDLQGNWWRIDTVALSTNTGFERRLICYPAKFDEHGQLVTNMVFSDYPLYLPEIEGNRFDNPGPDWYLVSYNPTATASSSLSGHEPAKAFDENIRTWWSAQTGDVGEWLMADLGKLCAVNAVQLNFADQDVPANITGRNNTYRYRYLMEFSQDGQTWFTLVDNSNATAEPNKAQDTSHDYFELASTIGVRYIRVTNKGAVPGGGKFAISGLRLFGNGGGTAPGQVTNVTVNRPVADERTVTVSWNAVPGAQGYIIRFGNYADGLNLHYQVIGGTSATIRCLNMGVDYYFTVDSYNDSGYTKGTETVFAKATQSVPPNKPVAPPISDPEKAAGYPVYEAEDATVGNGATKASDAAASGGRCVQNLHLANAYIEFTNIDGGPGGDATLRLVFSNGNASADTELIVNGVSQGSLHLKTTAGWSRYKMMEFPITNLKPGATNTIRLVGGREGFNPDYIQILY